METELRHRSVPQANGLAAAKRDTLVINGDTADPQRLGPTKAKHGRAMQVLRGVSLFLYFFLSCVA